LSRRLVPRLPRGLRLGVLVLAGLLPALPLPVAALGELPVTTTMPVNIDCHDGAPIHATVDSVQMAKIAAAAQAMLDNGSGGTCDVNNDRHDGEREAHTFVFGSGVYHDPTFDPPCFISFSIKAVKDDDGNTQGFQSATLDPTGCLTAGHIRANVTCLAELGKLAQLKGVVTESSGDLAVFPPGSLLTSDVQDSEHGVPDRIFQQPAATPPQDTCQAGTHGADLLALDRGSIEVSP
jgi:hypothetical protein